MRSFTGWLAAFLFQLVCTPGGRLLNEGELVLASDRDLSDLGRRIVYAIAAGRTKFNEIQQVVRTDPSRSGERYEEAFRFHLRRLAEAGELGEGILATGPFWAD